MAQPQSSPSTSAQPPSAPGGQAPSKSNNADPHSSPAFPPHSLDWEGDKLLHIYMIDYCRKRNFKQTVQSLAIEADLDPERWAPIDAPQGLLFEWWVVFWDIFQAKSSEGGGSAQANAYLYAQRKRADARELAPQVASRIPAWQHSQDSARQLQQGPIPRPGMHSGAPPNGLPLNPPPHQAPGPGGAYPHPQTMPNGIPPESPFSAQHPGQMSMAPNIPFPPNQTHPASGPAGNGAPPSHQLGVPPHSIPPAPPSQQQHTPQHPHPQSARITAINAAAASANGQRINAPPPPQQQAFQSPGMMRNGAPPPSSLGMGLIGGPENIGLAGQRGPGAQPTQPQQQQQPPQSQQQPQPSQPGYPPNMHGQPNGIGPPSTQPQSTPGAQPTMPHPFHMMNQQPPSSQPAQQQPSQQQPQPPQQQQQFSSSRAPTPSDQRQNPMSQGQQQSASTTPAPHPGMGAQPSPTRAMPRPQSQPQHGVGMYSGGAPGKNNMPPGGGNIFGIGGNTGGGAGTSGSTSVPGSGVMVPATIPPQSVPPMPDALKVMLHQQSRDPGQQPTTSVEDTARQTYQKQYQLPSQQSKAPGVAGSLRSISGPVGAGGALPFGQTPTGNIAMNGLHGQMPTHLQPQFSPQQQHQHPLHFQGMQQTHGGIKRASPSGEGDGNRESPPGKRQRLAGQPLDRPPMTGGVPPGFHPGAPSIYNNNGVGRGMAPPGSHQPGQQPPGYPSGPLTGNFQPSQQGVSNMSLQNQHLVFRQQQAAQNRMLQQNSPYFAGSGVPQMKTPNGMPTLTQGFPGNIPQQNQQPSQTPTQQQHQTQQQQQQHPQPPPTPQQQPSAPPQGGIGASPLGGASDNPGRSSAALSEAQAQMAATAGRGSKPIIRSSVGRVPFPPQSPSLGGAPGPGGQKGTMAPPSSVAPNSGGKDRGKEKGRDEVSSSSGADGGASDSMSAMGPPSTPKPGDGSGTKPPTPAPGSTTFSHPSVSPSNIMGNANNNSAPASDNTVSPHAFSRRSPSTNNFNSNGGLGPSQASGMGLSGGGMGGNRGGPSSFLGGGGLGPTVDLFGNLGGLGGNLGGMLPLDDYVVDMSNETPFTDSELDKYFIDFLGDPKTGDSKDDDVAAAMA